MNASLEAVIVGSHQLWTLTLHWLILLIHFLLCPRWTLYLPRPANCPHLTLDSRTLVCALYLNGVRLNFSSIVAVKKLRGARNVPEGQHYYWGFKDRPLSRVPTVAHPPSLDSTQPTCTNISDNVNEQTGLGI